jgi:hypothetical protein
MCRTIGGLDDPALAHGWAIIATDSGHKGVPFDTAFMRDQQAGLDFAFNAVPTVTRLGKELVAEFYGRAPDHSYSFGCSTGGREGMIGGSVNGDNTGKKIDITRAGASGDRVFGVFPEGDLGIDEATPGSYDLQLGLARYGSRLAGFATTNARPSTPAPALSFLVELTRR